jgi:putative membrane protein
MTHPLRLATLSLAIALSLHAQAQTAPPPNDAQIAAIVVTANQVDVDAGKLAEGKTRSKAVKAFAQQMVTDHSGVNKMAVDLVTKLKVTPQDNATAQGLQKGGDDNLAKLRTLDGAAFDKAYVDYEVAYHEAVLAALDKVLIPSAANAELKALLVKVRPAIDAHLQHARYLQAELGPRGG